MAASRKLMLSSNELVVLVNALLGRTPKLPEGFSIKDALGLTSPAYTATSPSIDGSGNGDDRAVEMKDVGAEVDKDAESLDRLSGHGSEMIEDDDPFGVATPEEKGNGMVERPQAPAPAPAGFKPPQLRLGELGDVDNKPVEILTPSNSKKWFDIKKSMRRRS